MYVIAGLGNLFGLKKLYNGSWVRLGMIEPMEYGETKCPGQFLILGESRHVRLYFSTRDRPKRPISWQQTTRYIAHSLNPISNFIVLRPSL
jgi:hypothetical protein